MRHQRRSRLGHRVKSGELKKIIVRPKVWEAENDRVGRLRAAKTGRCEPSTNGPVFMNSILSHLESALRTNFRRRWLCSLYLSFFVEDPNRNGFLNAIAKVAETSGTYRYSIQTTARRDATSGFAPVKSYRTTLSSPCSTYICRRCRCMVLLQGFLRYPSLQSVYQISDTLGICSELAFASCEWLIESP